MHESECGPSEASASKAGRMHSRQRVRVAAVTCWVMTSLTRWAAGQTHPSSLAPQTAAPGPKQTLLPGAIPKHPSCLGPPGSRQPLRMMYGRAQRKGKWRLETELRKCDNSSSPEGQAGAGRLAQGVTAVVIKPPGLLSTVRALTEELAGAFSPQSHRGSRGSRPCFWGKAPGAGTLPPSFPLLLARASLGRGQQGRVGQGR